MKEGTGDDPFAEDAPEEPEQPESVDADVDADPETAGTPESTPGPSPASMPAETEYPYFLLRDTVKEDRTNEHVYFLRDEFAAREREVHDAVEERLGEEVYLTDLREALVATADPGAIAAQLKEWGQGIK